MKTTNFEHNASTNKGLIIILECDKQAKEERLKYVRENRIENGLVIENKVSQYEKINFRKIYI